MFVDLDTRDLITLEHDEGELLARLEAGLRLRGARLLLSFGVVNELAGASRRGTGSGLMRLLCRLEELPHTWIREFDLFEQEVDRALVCFSGVDAYRAPKPYVESYLDTSYSSEDFPAWYRSKSLAEIMWDQLDEERRIGPLRLTSPGFQNRIALVREEIVQLEKGVYQEEIKRTFMQNVRRIAAERVGKDFVAVDEFAAAVWTHPEWCGGSRLQFEVQWAFARDVQTTPTASDTMDFARMLHIPYVDVFTTDNSKREYLSQLARGRASRLHGCGYWTRCAIARDIYAVIDHLEDDRAG